MKKLSLPLLADTVSFRRKEKKLTQAGLAAQTGMNRSLLSRLEAGLYMPSADQLQALSEALDFDPAQLFLAPETEKAAPAPCRVAVAGTGYVGLSLAVLLSQHNEVTAVDIVPEKVEKLLLSSVTSRMH